MPQRNPFMKQRILFLLILAGILFCMPSCNDNEHAVSIRHITTRTAPDNVLRIPVTVDFSAPCTFTVTYWEQGHRSRQLTTPPVTTGGATGEVTLKFLKGRTTYEFQVNVAGGTSSKVYSFTTQPVPIDVPAFTLAKDQLGGRLDGYVLQWEASDPGYVTFCDMQGNVVWYQQFPEAIRTASYDPRTHTLQLMTGFADEHNHDRLCAHIIRTDLDGNVLLNQTPSDRTVRYPHHDFRLLPDGNFIFVNNVVRTFDLSTIGGTAAQQVWGDGFTVLSPEGNVLKRWDCFAAIDPVADDAYLHTTRVADDLIHANSVNQDVNGDFYMTFNRLSELWKIDGRTGRVLYRVGPHGNVSMPAADMASGLHSATPLAPDRVLCFDNGRKSGASRAIIYEVNPTAMTARATLSIRLPSDLSSTDRSNAQLLQDHSLMFFGSTQGRASVITDLDGNLLWVLRRSGISYRSYYYPRSAF